MKVFCKAIPIFGFILLNLNWIHAQTTETKLDQVKLMKQFLGTWKFELGTDTFLISENIPFGAGMISSGQIVTKEKCLDSIKQLYGYDKKMDKFIVAELFKSSPIVEICTAWFTSTNAGELVVTNPDTGPIKFKYEFIAPDLIVQTALIENKVVKKVIGKRVK
jgi:hypothetical protein